MKGWAMGLWDRLAGAAQPLATGDGIRGKQDDPNPGSDAAAKGSGVSGWRWGWRPCVLCGVPPHPPQEEREGWPGGWKPVLHP